MSTTVVITGANRGIGLAFTKLYLARNCKVFAVCRDASPELLATEAHVVAAVDLLHLDSMVRIEEAVGDKKVDILINNAGILRDEPLGNINYHTIVEQFHVNAVGALYVTESLLQNLGEGSKVAFITSRMGSIADNSSGGRYGYRMSKAALNAAAKSLSIDLKPKGISIAVLHPGYVQTDMVGNNGDISAETASERLAQRIDELELSNSGTFWHSNGEVLPW
ncbi:MAG: short-chain dehydrogenase [Alteromonadaceae bacterium]|nr:MAG: short-chain dehydrogenase [Alteromonadaceae bacterium]